MFVVDADVTLTNRETLRILVEQNRFEFLQAIFQKDNKYKNWSFNILIYKKTWFICKNAAVCNVDFIQCVCTLTN